MGGEKKTLHTKTKNKMEHTLLLLSSSSPSPSLFTPHPQKKLTFLSKHTLITIKFKSFTSNHSFKVKCGEVSSSSDYFQQSSPPRFSPSYSPPSTPTFSPASPPKVFVGHSIYKGKAALTVEPKAPEFAPLESGALKLSREGFVLLQFAPAAGVRQYDWSRKQVFSLSVSEIGSLISLGAKESCEYFHDPNKGKSDEGKVRKVLKVEPLPDGSGHFFNLSVQNKLLNMDESIYIPITKAEFAVLVSAFNFILPYLLGWHAFVDSVRPAENNRVNNTSPRGTVDYEWSR